MADNFEKYLLEHFQDLCRYCLTLNTEKNYFQDLRTSIHCKKIGDTIGYQFSADDALPKTVCLKCKKEIEKYIDFRENCLASYRSLTDVLKSNSVKEEYLIEEVLITPKIEYILPDETLYDAGFQQQNDDAVPKKEKKGRQCTVCGKLVYDFARHIQNHLRSKLYECHHCQKKFHQRNSFRRHVLIHLGVKNFKCDQCPKAFLETRTLNMHKKTHSNIRAYTCNICFKSFKQAVALTTHNLTHTQPKTVACTVENCSKLFNTIAEMKSHHRSHKPRIECGVCHKKLKAGKNWENHEKMHSGVLTYKCNLCPKAFGLELALKVHNRLKHSTGPLAFACEICGQPFGFKSGLLSHVRFRHNQPVSYACGTCGRIFSSKLKLKEHTKTQCA